MPQCMCSIFQLHNETGTFPEAHNLHLTHLRQLGRLKSADPALHAAAQLMRFEAVHSAVPQRKSICAVQGTYTVISYQQ